MYTGVPPPPPGFNPSVYQPPYSNPTQPQDSYNFQQYPPQPNQQYYPYQVEQPSYPQNNLYGNSGYNPQYNQQQNYSYANQQQPTHLNSNKTSGIDGIIKEGQKMLKQLDGKMLLKQADHVKGFLKNKKF